MGIDLGGTALKASLVSSAGILLHPHAMPSRAEQGPDAAVAQIRAAVYLLRREARERGIEPECAGMGCPGTIDAEGAVGGALPNLPGFRGIPMKPILSRITGLPVVVENDANLMAYGEALVGAGSGFDSVLGVTIGTGIGAGIVLGGRIYRGAGAAGELGHVRMVSGGRPCPCGGRGCLEQYASGPALGRLHRERTGEDLDAQDVLRQWQEGAPEATVSVRRWAGYLAKGLAMAISLVHPSCLVLGGGVMTAGATLFELVDRYTRRGCLDVIAMSTVIRASRLGAYGGVVGAGLAALHARQTFRGSLP